MMDVPCIMLRSFVGTLHADITCCVLGIIVNIFYIIGGCLIGAAFAVGSVVPLFNAINDVLKHIGNREKATIGGSSVIEELRNTRRALMIGAAKALGIAMLLDILLYIAMKN